MKVYGIHVLLAWSLVFCGIAYWGPLAWAGTATLVAIAPWVAVLLGFIKPTTPFGRL